MPKSVVPRAIRQSSRCLYPRNQISICPVSAHLISKTTTTADLRLPHSKPFLSLDKSQLSAQARRYASTSLSPSAIKLEKTPLYSLHVEYGAKMVPFAGYSMPVQYAGQGIIESHTWTREKASLFDVGHMVQHRITGPKACEFLESMTPTSLSALEENRSSLSCLLHPSGGIVDDCVIARLAAGEWYMVTNAACREKDLSYLAGHATRFRKQHGESSLKMEIIPNGLIALQGPLSAEVLQDHAQILNSDSAPSDPARTDLKLDLQTFYFGACIPLTIKLPNNTAPFPALISRGGYTGEDGFELSIPAEHTVAITRLLLESAGPEKLRLAGLGARDSLRLEAGMCLYGHDLDDTITPVEAGLGWIVSKPRRAAADFPGAETILEQLQALKGGGEVLKRRRVGLVVEKVPAREGALISVAVAPSGAEDDGSSSREVGRVTSGCPSPTLGKNIAMGYVESGLHKPGTELEVTVRGKRYKANVVRMPFVESRYWKQAAGTAPG